MKLYVSCFVNYFIKCMSNKYLTLALFTYGWKYLTISVSSRSVIFEIQPPFSHFITSYLVDFSFLFKVLYKTLLKVYNDLGYWENKDFLCHSQTSMQLHLRRSYAHYRLHSTLISQWISIGAVEPFQVKISIPLIQDSLLKQFLIAKLVYNYSLSGTKSVSK